MASKTEAQLIPLLPLDTGMTATLNDSGQQTLLSAGATGTEKFVICINGTIQWVQASQLDHVNHVLRWAAFQNGGPPCPLVNLPVTGLAWLVLEGHLVAVGRVPRHLLEAYKRLPAPALEGLHVPVLQEQLPDALIQGYYALGVELVAVLGPDRRVYTALVQELAENPELLRSGKAASLARRVPVDSVTLRLFYVGCEPSSVFGALALAAGAGYEEVALADGQPAYILGGPHRSRAMDALHAATC
jgi:hypothetical protein